MTVYLRLDLGSGEQRSEPATRWAGPLMALRNLRAALVAGADPPVAFVTSRVAGCGGVGLARCAAVGVSPLSGGVAETRAEGPFAAGLRGAGVIGIGLTGVAGAPSYVVVEAGRARVRPARELWGLDTAQATAALRERHGRGAAVAVIGPAGEAGTRYANVVTCGSFPLPRLGFGAILGARRVKAIVCLPGAAARPADPAAVERLTAAYAAQISTNPLALWQRDDPGFGAWSGTVTNPGYASVRNFSDTDTAAGQGMGLAPQRFSGHLTWTAGGCPGCPNDCVKGFLGAGLHQEAVAMLGPHLGIDDLDAVLAANAHCQDLGLDPVSFGGTLGAVFEAAERGAAPDWLPARARFGNAAALLELVELAARPGHPLGQGAARLAAQLGMPEVAMVSGGVELPPFDPRVQPGLGLMYAAAPIGPRYDAVEHDLDFDPVHGMPHCYPEARRLGLTVLTPASTLDLERTIRLADLWSGLDALMVCPYASTPTRPLTLDRVCELVAAVTGHGLDPEAVFALGRERLALQQEINDLLGVPDAALPERFHSEPVRSGVFAGAVLDRDAFGAAVRELRALWRAPA